jgi:hypothetical protein
MKAGNVIETHEQMTEFKNWQRALVAVPTDFAS